MLLQLICLSLITLQGCTDHATSQTTSVKSFPVDRNLTDSRRSSITPENPQRTLAICSPFIEVFNSSYANPCSQFAPKSLKVYELVNKSWKMARESQLVVAARGLENALRNEVQRVASPATSAWLKNGQKQRSFSMPRSIGEIS